MKKSLNNIRGTIYINHDASLKKNYIFNKEEYALVKKFNANGLRKELLNRDKCCKACGETNNLQIAHITSCIDFVKRYGKKGIEQSFRLDNILILCSKCHIEAQHAMLNGLDINEKTKERARNIFRLFEKIIAWRRWRTLKDLEHLDKKRLCKLQMISWTVADQRRKGMKKDSEFKTALELQVFGGRKIRKKVKRFKYYL